MIYVVWRVDNDAMENHEPISKAIAGYASSVDGAANAARALFEVSDKYEGPLHGHAGPVVTFPRFEVQAVESLDPGGAVPTQEVHDHGTCPNGLGGRNG